MKDPGRIAFFGGLVTMAGIGVTAWLDARFGPQPSWVLLLIIGPCFLFTARSVLRAIKLDRNKTVLNHAGEDWSAQYQTQMAKVRKYVYPSLALFFISILSAMTGSYQTIGRLCQLNLMTLNPLMMLLIIANIVGIITIIVGINRWSKCPACNETPPQRGARGGVPLHLDRCPRCGAILSQAEVHR